MSVNSISIGGSNSGHISQAGGDLEIVNLSAPPDVGAALRAVEEVRAAMAGLSLSWSVAPVADRSLDELERELRRPRPDRREVATRLQWLTELLAGAGALASAGGTLVEGIGTIARWLGPFGTSIARAMG
jgi:hypothetical protein